MQSNLAEKLNSTKAERLTVTQKSIDEIRADVRAEAASRGRTVEEELDEFERISGCKEYADALRVLYGILSYEEVWGPR
jgi:hypothetical protein